MDFAYRGWRRQNVAPAIGGGLQYIFGLKLTVLISLCLKVKINGIKSRELNDTKWISVVSCLKN